MINSPKRISHIGIAVTDLDEAIIWYQEVLGLLFEGIEIIESEQVRVAFFRVGESRIELLEPLSETSPIARHIAKRGEGIHHIAFEVEDIQERLKELSLKGVALIHDEPKRGAHQSRIAFLHPKSTGGVLMELCQPVSEEM
jgi:methylmalonyl-CoA epimerase